MNAIAQLRTLKDAGLSEQQAEAVIGVIEESGEAGGLRTWMLDTFANKRELAELETCLTTRLFTSALAFAGIVLAGVYFMLNFSR